MSAIAEDLRASLRSLVRRPGLACATGALLAVGLGSATAVFTLLDALLLRPLDVRDPGSLVQLVSQDDEGNSRGFSRPVFQALAREARGVESLFASAGAALTVEWDGPPERAAAWLYSGQAFQTLGIEAAHGRILEPEDDRPGSGVVVLGHQYWQRRFGASLEVLGSTVEIQRRPYTVVGVAARGFSGWQPGVPCDLILPLSHMDALREGPDWDSPTILWLSIHGRLKTEASLEQARAGVQSGWPGLLEATVPPTHDAQRRERYLAHGIDVVSAGRGSSRYQREFSEPLTILGIIALLTLLLIATNVASLALARATERNRETAVRLSLGAGRARLFRSVVFENLLISLTGAALSVPIGHAAAAALLEFWGSGPGWFVLDLRLDSRLFVFLMGASLLTTLCASLAPALKVSRGGEAQLLRAGALGIAGGRTRTTEALVALQVALSLVLLAGAGLFVQTLENLTAQQIDFEPDNVLLLSLEPVEGDYGDRNVVAYYESLRRDVAAIPGVLAVAFSSSAPMQYWSQSKVQLEDVDDEISAFRARVSPAFFSVMESPLQAGRDFRSGDTAAAPRVAIINRALAEDRFPNGALGRRIDGSEIVGVVADAGYRGFRQTRDHAVYQPHSQPRQRYRQGNLTMSVRTAGAPRAVLRAVAERIDARGVEWPVRVSTLREETDAKLLRERAAAVVAAALAGIAVLISAFGLYALLAFVVQRRTRELGVRVALGAQRKHVMGGVIGRGLALAALGLLAGAPAVWWTGRLARNQLFGVAPADPTTTLCAAAALLVIALAASLAPAVRAARLSPTSALRHD